MLPMDLDSRAEAARKLELALDLFDFGEEVQRSNLRRQHPTLSEEEIEGKLCEWLRARPGAVGGDAIGRIRRWDDISIEARTGAA